MPGSGRSGPGHREPAGVPETGRWGGLAPLFRLPPGSAWSILIGRNPPEFGPPSILPRSVPVIRPRYRNPAPGPARRRVPRPDLGGRAEAGPGRRRAREGRRRAEPIADRPGALRRRNPPALGQSDGGHGLAGRHQGRSRPPRDRDRRPPLGRGDRQGRDARRRRPLVWLRRGRAQDRRRPALGRRPGRCRAGAAGRGDLRRRQDGVCGRRGER